MTKNVPTGRCCDYCTDQAVGYYTGGKRYYYCQRYAHERNAWADHRSDIAYIHPVKLPEQKKTGKV